MSEGSRLGACALALAAVLGGCGQKIQDQYGVEIVGPIGVDYLAGAKTMVLEVGGKELSRTAISPGVPFALGGEGINTSTMTSGVIRLRALDAAGAVVAYGQSPEVELSLFSYNLRVFVQRPGTFGPALSLDYPRRNLVAVTATAAPPTGTNALPLTVAYFGMGQSTVDVQVGTTNMTMPVEGPSDLLYIYNPLTHTPDDGGISGTIGGVRQPRLNPAALVRPDGSTIYIFGGTVRVDAMSTPHVTSQLDVLRVVRPDFDLFQQRVAVTARTTDKPGVARSRTVLADADLTYAFGGDADGTELDTVVTLNPMVDDAFAVLDLKMGAPRVGHTATPVTVSAVPEVLVFGGQHADAAVAEVLVSGTTPSFVKPEGETGPTRWDHAAILLPPDRVLIVGGNSAAGPLGDSLIYSARQRQIGPGPITLKTARAAFAAFVVGADLVISGGVDAQGQAIGDAEVFDISDPQLKSRGVVPNVKRSGAAAAVLANESALLIGGTGADGKATRSVEIYQPFR
jgi:hypothetical protein